MKIHYKHLVKYIESKPDITELSQKLFQLGHEHEISSDIFEIEFTPNRGDCLSLKGLLRDLRLFYKVADFDHTYDQEIKPFDMQFINNAKHSCKKISFLKIEIDKVPTKYKGSLKDFFLDLDLKKNNFTLINFWASWCGPCRIEHPMLLKLNEEKNLELLGVNFKDKKNNALEFLKDLGDPYDDLARDELGKHSINFGIYGIPESILINKDLVIIKKFIGPISKNDYDFIKLKTFGNLNYNVMRSMRYQQILGLIHLFQVTGLTSLSLIQCCMLTPLMLLRHQSIEQEHLLVGLQQAQTLHSQLLYKCLAMTALRCLVLLVVQDRTMGS